MTASRSRRALFAAVVTGAVFGLAELAARQVNPVLPQWTASDNPSVVMTGHPTRLWGLAPGERRNVDTVATVSELGLRGEVPVIPRPFGEERIAVIGDSFNQFEIDIISARITTLGEKVEDIFYVTSNTTNLGLEQSITDQLKLALQESLDNHAQKLSNNK